MPVDLELAPKTKRPPGDPCCEPIVYPDVERDQAERMAAIAKALGDPVRLQLVDVLRKHAGKVCVCELVPLFDLSQPTVSHHLKVLRDAGIVGSERQGLWAYYYVIPDALRGAVRMAGLSATRLMANALFVCLHNAGRSQMSQALFERAAEGRHGARSAGTTPGDRVHPEVVEVMGELGIDLADRVPHGLTEEDARWADVVVTMGCGDKCPYIPGRRYVDWDLADPKGRPVEEVRATRDEIERRVGELVAELDSVTRS